MQTDQKLRIMLRSVLRAAEALPSEPWDKGFGDRRRALEEACVEAREVLRVIDNEEAATVDWGVEPQPADPIGTDGTGVLPDSITVQPLPESDGTDGTDR